MIRGCFEPHLGSHPPWPVFPALVRFPEFRTEAIVNFVADTEADMTVIHPKDSARLLPAGARLGHDQPVTGVGSGTAQYAVREIAVVLTHDGQPSIESGAGKRL